MGVLIFSLIIYLNLPKPILSIILHLNCSNPNETPGSERIMHFEGRGCHGDCHYTINLGKKKKKQLWKILSLDIPSGTI